MLIGRVVEDNVDDDAHAAAMGVGDQTVEIGECPERRINGLVIRHVISEVDLRGRVERRDPQRVDAEIGQVGQPGLDARKIADAIAIGVVKAADVDFVKDGLIEGSQGCRGLKSLIGR